MIHLFLKKKKEKQLGYRWLPSIVNTIIYQGKDDGLKGLELGMASCILLHVSRTYQNKGKIPLFFFR